MNGEELKKIIDLSLENSPQMRAVLEAMLKIPKLVVIGFEDLQEPCASQKLTYTDVVFRCYKVLDNFYDYYKIKKPKSEYTDIVDSKIKMPPELISSLTKEAKDEYSEIWAVIIIVEKEKSLRLISEADLQALNSYYKKYKGQ